MMAGEVAVRVFALVTLTFVAGTIILSVGLVSTKLTVVAFGTKPDPVIVIPV